MNKDNFYYWIKGFSELSENAPTQKEWETIKDHINLVDGQFSVSGASLHTYRPFNTNGLRADESFQPPSTC